MHIFEILSALGAPARAAARVLFIPRYCVDNFSPLRSWPCNGYAGRRFGSAFRWRIWLLYDLRELEALEKLINEGSDEDLLRMRDARLESFRLVALVGALLAAVALQALSLPHIEATSFCVRAAFTVSLMLSILATFFTCIQQRELGHVRGAPALRAWLSNGVRYTNLDGKMWFQSSLAALHLLESPYEYLSLAIINFVAGMAAYLWSAWANGVKLHAEGGVLTDVAVIVYFAIATGFAFSVFPTLLGSKDREIRAVGNALDILDRRMDDGSGGDVCNESNVGGRVNDYGVGVCT